MTRTYRGWAIECQVEVVQLGYRVGEGMRSRPGRGRKCTGYQVTGPDGTSKFKDTLQEAKAYIDAYVGD